MANQQPIGIFDSGIGGLTVAKAINELLPNEQLIYFGDTAHFPYGDKERKSIQHYGDKIAEFLLKNNCKSIVIACNTASSACYNTLRKSLPNNFPIYDVIHPVADYVAKNHRHSKIGIIATKGTTNSRAYPKLISEKAPNTQVKSCATPLLAPMIEEGFFNNNISKSIIKSYLTKKHIANINALILACTHYPIIEKEISNHYKSIDHDITIINSAKVVAQKVKSDLAKKDLLSSELVKNHEFFVSDYTKSFEQSSEIFFGKSVKLQKIQLWK